MGVALIAVFLPFGTVFGDGFSAHRLIDNPMSSWELSTEESQVCFITHQLGEQRMILSVVLSADAEELVWIFPVPADPDEVEIDVVEELPAIKGVNVDDTARKVVNMALANVRACVYVPLPEDYPYPRESYSLGGVLRSEVKSEEVIIHEQVNKLGISTVLVSARTADALNGYLEAIDVHLPEESLPLIDEYIGEDYCFVVSWATHIDQYRSEMTIGVQVGFPSDKAYFPLKLTSIYGNMTIPITIYIKNHVIPELYTGIDGHCDADYFIQTRFNNPRKIVGFIDNLYHKSNLEFTKVTIDAESHWFKEDLWFHRGRPWSYSLAHLILTNQFITRVLIGFTLFGLSSLLSALVVMGRKIPKVRFFLLGEFNFFTLLFLCFGYLLVTARDRKGEGGSVYSGEPLSEGSYNAIAEGMMPDKRVVAYIPLFVIILLTSAYILQLATSLLL